MEKDFIISKEDFKKYFNCKKEINKKELINYYKGKGLIKIKRSD